VLIVENARVLATTPGVSEKAPSTIGATLRDARERAGLSLRQIADTTKLSVHVLTALEQNRITQLPGGIYRRSIVRAFAREVGLDAEKTLRVFLDQYPDEVPSAVPPRAEAAPPGASRRLFRALASTLGAAVPIAAGIYYFTAGAPASRSQSSQRRTAEPPAATRAGEVVPTRVVRPEDEGRVISMIVTAAARTRLQVVADGQEILARPLNAGEEVRLEFSTDVVVNGDDAGVVHVTLNGHDTQSLGVAGAPLNVRIPREGYRDWLRQR
jgi:transcriptional regulator with XRE-family HTH domain